MKDLDDDEPVRHHLGDFLVSVQKTLVGELCLDGPKTLLKVYSTSGEDQARQDTRITGMSYSGNFLTLIDCVNQGTSSTWNDQGIQRYQADIFPHYVAIGRRHLDTTLKCIRAVHFTIPDASSLFHDWDAFGHVIDAGPIIEHILRERRGMRPVRSGIYPEVAYFAGETCIVELQTRIGKISVNHRPSTNPGGPDGVYIKNKIIVSIEPESPVNFRTAIEATFELYGFLSMAAGRGQQIKAISLEITPEGEKYVPPVLVYPSYFFGRDSVDDSNPRHADFPLDPIHRRDEFEAVIADWMNRNPSWKDARGRYLGCIGNGTMYSPDRLVAAANMFELLPSGAEPKAPAVPQDLASARDACREILLKLGPCPARDGVLGALGRIGKPSLRGKIEHRAALITSQLPGVLNELDHVIGIAVKRRNFYVHGSPGGLDMDAVGPFTPFLTDTLEFIFSASDFVEAGWDIAKWYFGHRGWGHPISRFRNEYDSNLLNLLKVVPKVATSP